MHQLDLALQQACHGAVQSVRQRCISGPATACDAAAPAAWIVNSGGATSALESDPASLVAARFSPRKSCVNCTTLAAYSGAAIEP
jgi:hypothetical protein